MYDWEIKKRTLIRQAVGEVVQNKMDKLKDSQTLSKIAEKNVPIGDRNRFIEIAEIEVSSLHEGNFARFKIRPSEFFEWQRLWK